MEDREDMIAFIINRFACLCPDLSLKVYGIPIKDLSLYVIKDKAVLKA